MKGILVVIVAFHYILPCLSFPFIQEVGRRNFVDGSLLLSNVWLSTPSPLPPHSMEIWNDLATYISLVYTPPMKENESSKYYPLIIFLPGAGRNLRDVTNLADPIGEYGGLLPSLVSTKLAPNALMDNFVLVSPYCQGSSSFYNEPRSKLLTFISNFISWYDANHGKIFIDRNRLFLFGFSDGATLAVELLTTRRFAGAIVASYGYTGEMLPSMALQRLKGIPMWVFHSEDDVIYSVSNSDRLVNALRTQSINQNTKHLVRYSRFQQDPEGLTGSLRGHSTGLTASKDPRVYEWLLSLPPLSQD
jgi:predicted peptidase